jgi:hypothetical protein
MARRLPGPRGRAPTAAADGCSRKAQACDNADVDQDEQLGKIAGLLRSRNSIDEEIAEIIQRPMASGHLGEWVASRIFDIELAAVAVEPGFDGRFRSLPLQGKTVNIRWYLKREGLIDTSEAATLDYYLVLTGPPSSAASSHAGTRPWRIDAVYLFDARRLRSEQVARSVKSGTASSVIRQQWAAAEIYPAASNPILQVTARQAELLELFRL